MIDNNVFDGGLFHLPQEFKERISIIALLAGDEHRQVYSVWDKYSNCKAILKWTDEYSADDAQREHVLLNKLSHESIPKAIAFTKEGGRDYLLRSFAQGETLDELINRDGCFSARRTAEIVLSLCEVMGYLHSQEPPIIFKDIKPENIVLTANGKLGLIDFGIAREKHRNKDRDTRLMGSFPYASPEHLGFRDTDQRSDIFSIGRLMAYLCTGDVLGTAPDRELQAIIKKCTHLEPKKRYSNVQKLEKALRRILNPLSRWEIAVIVAIALFVVAGGMSAASLIMKTPSLPAASPVPISADRREQEKNMLIPVKLQVINSGEPYADCVVTADGTHWYVPQANAQAQLNVFPFREHIICAAKGNREVNLTVSELDIDKRHTLDIDIAPLAPEIIELDINDIKKGYKLPFEKTEKFAWTHSAEGFSIKKEGKNWLLTVDENLEYSPKRLLMGKCENSSGVADVNILVSTPNTEEPTLIYTAQELFNIRNNLCGNYALATDIDLSSISNWTPIGNERFPFTGSFDGMGHVIKGLKQQQDFEGCAGLFGKVENAYICRIILKEANILANHNAFGGTGCLIGWQVGGLTEHCASIGGSIYADVGYESGIGGLIGLNQMGMISGCFDDTWVRVEANSCFAKGMNMSGGLVGVNSGYITLSGFAGELHGNCIAAGISGFCDKGIIKHCYSAGIVKAPNYIDTFAPGGIAHMLTRSGRISNCVFDEQTAAIGANVSRGGVLEGIIPLPKVNIQKGESLLEALRLEKESGLFVSLPDIHPYPLPAYIATALSDN